MKTLVLIIALFMASCEVRFVENKNQTTTLSKEFTPIVSGNWYKPSLLTSWQAQIFGSVNLDYNARMYVVDLFNTRPEFVSGMKTFNKQVVCYFSAGVVYADDRDVSHFSKFVVGKNIDSDYVKWLDISSDRIIPIIKHRLDLALSNGCDGVLIGDLNEYKYDNGFNITQEQQTTYAKFIANEAHNRGLGVGILGLDGVSSMYQELEPYFDFVVSLDCYGKNTCDSLSVFRDKQKGIFDIEFGLEYVRNGQSRYNMCVDMKRLSISAIVLPVRLDGEFRYDCSEL